MKIKPNVIIKMKRNILNITLNKNTPDTDINGEIGPIIAVNFSSTWTHPEIFNKLNKNPITEFTKLN